MNELKNPNTSINGWLYLPAIGMVVTPLWLLNNLTSYINTFTLKAFAPLNGLAKTLVLYEYIGALIFVIFSIYMSVSFFKKRKIFVKLFIYFMCSHAVYVLVNIVLTIIVIPSKTASSIPFLTRDIVIGAIWIPYFLKSTRVKNIFTK